MNTPISPAVLVFAAQQRHWRIDIPAERERMAADLAGQNARGIGWSEGLGYCSGTIRFSVSCKPTAATSRSCSACARSQ